MQQQGVDLARFPVFQTRFLRPRFLVGQHLLVLVHQSGELGRQAEWVPLRYASKFATPHAILAAKQLGRSVNNN